MIPQCVLCVRTQKTGITHRSLWQRCVQFKWPLEISLLSHRKTPFIQSSQCVPLTYAFSAISLANLTIDFQYKIFHSPFTIHLNYLPKFPFYANKLHEAWKMKTEYPKLLGDCRALPEIQNRDLPVSYTADTEYDH